LQPCARRSADSEGANEARIKSQIKERPPWPRTGPVHAYVQRARGRIASQLDVEELKSSRKPLAIGLHQGLFARPAPEKGLDPVPPTQSGQDGVLVGCKEALPDLGAYWPQLLDVDPDRAAAAHGKRGEIAAVTQVEGGSLRIA
jgi:hypothetical protein